MAWRSAAVENGSLEAANDGPIIWVEPASGIVRVLGEGSWTAAQVEAHFERLARMIADRRCEGHPILVLVDLRNAPAQEPAVAARISQATANIYRPNDRVAVLVESSLMKLQMKRSVSVQQLEFFLSVNAARTWLTAYC